MGGFCLDGFSGRVPCPHCGDRDCCGVSGDGRHLICSHTGRLVSEAALRKSALAHQLPRYSKYRLAGGREAHVHTFVPEREKAAFGEALVHVYHRQYGFRGAFRTLKEAEAWAAEHEGNPAAYHRAEASDGGA